MEFSEARVAISLATGKAVSVPPLEKMDAWGSFLGS